MPATDLDATPPSDSPTGAGIGPIAEAAIRILEALGIASFGSGDAASSLSTSSPSASSLSASLLSASSPSTSSPSTPSPSTPSPSTPSPSTPSSSTSSQYTLGETLISPRVPVIAIVGAGGKSTTTFSVASALTNQGRRVVVSTTTKMGHDQTGGFEPTLPNITAVERALQRPGICLVVEHPNPSSPKVVGPPTVWFDELAASGLVDAIVLEADGARRRNAKAPGPHEPVLPASTTHVLAVLGADALDRVIEDQGHRPMRIAAAVGCGPYDRLTPERAARLLSSDIGGRKGVTETMGFCAVITKMADDNRQNTELTAEFVLAAGFRIVLVPFDLAAGSVVRPTFLRPILGI